MENQQQLTKQNRTFLKSFQESTVNDHSDIILYAPNLPSVARLKADGLLVQVKEDLALCITEIIQFYNEVYSPDQIMMLIDMIIRSGYMLTAADFALFSKKCMQGTYKNRTEQVDGKDVLIKFFRLSPDVFYSWLLIYIADRSIEFANNSAVNKINRTEFEKHYSAKASEADLKLLEIFARKAKEKEESHPEPEVQQVIQKNTEDPFFLIKQVEEKFRKQFKEECICERLGEWKEIEVVIDGDKKLTINEYVAHKYNQIYDQCNVEYSHLEEQQKKKISSVEFYKVSLQKFISS